MSEDAPQYAVTPSMEIQTTYWQVVDGTLTRVFHGAEDAHRRLRILRQELENASDGTKGKLYQTEPLTVAADLAGQGHRALTPEEIHQYLEIKREFPLMLVSEIPTLEVLKSRFEE